MEPTALTSFYDKLKSELNSDKGDTAHNIPVTNMGGGVGRFAPAAPLSVVTQRQIASNCEKLKDDCRKHILCDIYVKILPLDDDFKQGHMGMCNKDIDCMLARKGMNATQYLTSCSDATRAPLLEYILRATDIIGKNYMKEAEEEVKDAAANGVADPKVKEPNVNDAEVQEQIVDVKKDSEYETFVDKLKEKTVNKIVSDVSKIITDKKEEKDMTFDVKPGGAVNAAATPVEESAISVCLDYINKSLIGKNIVMTESVNDDIIGMCIREATLNQLDVVFNQRDGAFNEYASRIRFGKGNIITEAAIMEGLVK